MSRTLTLPIEATGEINGKQNQPSIQIEQLYDEYTKPLPNALLRAQTTA